MQTQARMDRNRLKELAHELGIEVADLLRREFDVVNEKRASGDVDHDAGERLIQWNMGVAIAGDALAIAEREIHA